MLKSKCQFYTKVLIHVDCKSSKVFKSRYQGPQQGQKEVSKVQHEGGKYLKRHCLLLMTKNGTLCDITLQAFSVAV